MFSREWLLIGLLSSGAVLASDPTADVGAAISTSIRWQQEWFGHSFGADCVKIRAQKGAELTVFVPDGELRTTTSHGVTRFAAYVDGSNVLYSGKLWPGKAIAEPSAGNPNSCAPGEIAEQVQFNSQPGAISKGPFVFSPNGAEATIEPEQATLVLATVKRSMSNYYSRSNKAPPRGFYLGRYRSTDPFLIVMDSTRNQIFLLDFPALSSFDDTTVVDVYSGDIFLGPDITPEQRNRYTTHITSQLRSNSIFIRNP